jgi:alpha-glucosidase
MQWDEGHGAGFTTGEPWLPIANDYAMNNVAVLRHQSASILSLYRRLIELRRSEPALSVGDYAALPSGEDLMAYMRKAGERRLLIVLNFGATGRRFNLSELQAGASLLLSTYLDRAQEKLDEEFRLRGDEGVITELL